MKKAIVIIAAALTLIACDNDSNNDSRSVPRLERFDRIGDDIDVYGPNTQTIYYSVAPTVDQSKMMVCIDVYDGKTGKFVETIHGDWTGEEDGEAMFVLPAPYNPPGPKYGLVYFKGIELIIGDGLLVNWCVRC